MIEAKLLAIANTDGTTTQRCAGSTEGCREVLTTPAGHEPPIFPYICVPCWLKGWRNRSKFAYAPGEPC